MKLSTKFILFIIVIHAVTIALSFYIFRENKLIFIASEFFIVISLMICWSLYTELIAPLNLLTTGIDALRDKDFSIKFVETGRYEMDKLIGVYNAMLDQLRTERTVQQEQHFFLEKLIQTSPTGILILDFDENIYDLNPKASNILNLDKKQFKGRPLSIFDNLLIKAIEKLEKGASTTVNTEGGKKFKIQKSAFIDRGFQRIFVMIEELTTEIFEAEKQAYAKVIRMMAHEVNNSIGAVNSILDTVGHYLPPLGGTRGADAEVANALKIAIERNDHLNHFMRNFADVIRLPEPRKEHFDLTVLVKNVATLMEYKAKEKHISFDFQIEHPLSPEGNRDVAALHILADLGQIEQVLINIVKNAVEAQDKTSGFIQFKIDKDKRELSIIDNGKGIPKEIEPMLFSPFFTNKNGGQGIGLTLIREVLTNHGFAFSLNNRKEGGVIFKIVF
jgi:two-component system, NtrC family, nitrogen regulation sensor histidine kinase NtrY